MKEFKGKLTSDETERIQRVFQRKMALLELMPTIKNPMDKDSLDYLYEKIVDDLQQTNQRMQDWWLEVSKAHDWEYGEGYTWNVNFRDQEITIKSSSEET